MKLTQNVKVLFRLVMILAALCVFTLCLTEPGTDGFVITAVTLAGNVLIGVLSGIYLYKNRDQV